MSEQQSNEDAGEQSGEHQANHIPPLNGNDVTGSEPRLRNIILLLVEAGVAFWMICELLDASIPLWRAVFLFIGTSLILGWIAHTFSKKVWPNKVAVWVVYSLILLSLSATALIPRLRKPAEPEQKSPTIEEEISHYAKKARARQWHPPELPNGIMGVFVHLAGCGFGYEMSRLNPDHPGPPLVAFSGGQLVTPYVRDNRLYIRCMTPTGDPEITVKMNNESFTNLPPNWDVNFNQTMFEIVDVNQFPMLQMKYLQPYEILVQRIFVSPDGHVTVVFGNGLQSSAPGMPMPKIPNEKPWFKYPSKDHLGELAD